MAKKVGHDPGTHPIVGYTPTTEDNLKIAKRELKECAFECKSRGKWLLILAPFAILGGAMTLRWISEIGGWMLNHVSLVWPVVIR